MDGLKTAKKIHKNLPGMGKAGLPIFLCWLAYTTAYFGRYSYASNITAIMDAFGVNHADSGLVTTCFFFAYGIGQVVNGILCKYYPKKIVIPLALIASAGLNFAVFSGVPFSYLKYLWLLNGVAQSMLWPTLIFALSENLRAEDLSKAVVAMSTTVPIGTFVTYALSAALSTVGGFAYSFLFGTVMMSVSAVIWFILYEKAFRGEGERKENQPAAVKRKSIGAATLTVVAALCILAVANNLVKDGLTTWIPAILKESFGLPEYLSIILTLVLPVLGIFGSSANVLLRHRIKSFVTHAGLWYLLTVICIGIVIAFLQTAYWYVVLGAFGLISLFMHGTNSLITSIAPLYMRDKINSGLLAGVLNGCCYIGSTASSYGLGAIADNFGWGSVFNLLLSVCIGAVILAAGVSIWERHNNA